MEYLTLDRGEVVVINFKYKVLTAIFLVKKNIVWG